MVRKRCPNGTRKNPRTGNCEPIGKKTMKQARKKNIVAKAKTQKKKCPKDKPLYNPKTNRCLTDNAANRKKLTLTNIVSNKEIKHLSKKKCPKDKPLYNPKTNRCVKDTNLNRKKISKIELELDAERSKQLPIAKKTKGVIKTTQKIAVKDSGPFYNIEKCPAPYYKNINFDKLSLKEVSSSSFNIEYKTKQNKIITLTKTRMLGDGTYGQVFKYSDVSKRYNVAVKTYYSKNDDELKVIQRLETKKVDCNILASKRFETSQNPIIVCDIYSDSLNNIDLVKKISVRNKVLIIKQLANDLLCLNKKGFPYTDIKLANTLYKCLDKNKFKVTLGDIGSICLSEYSGITTYPPWEYKDNPSYVKCSNKQIVWGLGILLISLLHNNSNLYPFYWETIIYITEDIIKNYIVNYISLKEIREFIIIKSGGVDITLSTLIYSMLKLDPNERVSLERIVELLKNVK